MAIEVESILSQNHYERIEEEALAHMVNIGQCIGQYIAVKCAPLHVTFRHKVTKGNIG